MSRARRAPIIRAKHGATGVEHAKTLIASGIGRLASDLLLGAARPGRTPSHRLTVNDVRGNHSEGVGWQVGHQ